MEESKKKELIKQKEKEGKKDRTKKETRFVSELTQKMFRPVPNTLNNVHFMFNVESESEEFTTNSSCQSI